MKVEVDVDCCVSCPHLSETEVLSGFAGSGGRGTAYFCQKIKLPVENRFGIHPLCVFRKKRK